MKRRWGKVLWLGPLGLLAGLIAAALAAREPTERLTAANLAAARQRWTAAGLRDYSLDLDIGGTLYEVEVQRGAVISLRVGGHAAASHDAQSYSVDGWFSTLELDLELAADPHGPLAGGAELLRVRFHPQLGYPERYVRAVSSAGRTQVVQVRRLEPARGPPR